LKPTEGFLDGADHKKEDDHDFLYNLEIKNKLHIKKKKKLGWGLGDTPTSAN